MFVATGDISRFKFLQVASSGSATSLFGWHFGAEFLHPKFLTLLVGCILSIVSRHESAGDDDDHLDDDDDDHDVQVSTVPDEQFQCEEVD